MFVLLTQPCFCLANEPLHFVRLRKVLQQRSLKVADDKQTLSIDSLCREFLVSKLCRFALTEYEWLSKFVT